MRRRGNPFWRLAYWLVNVATARHLALIAALGMSVYQLAFVAFGARLAAEQTGAIGWAALGIVFAVGMRRRRARGLQTSAK